MRIGVLMGGVSAERDVSLNTGRGVQRALVERGRDPIAIDWNTREDLCMLLRRERIDTVWIALHGTLGEDGCVQGMLECLRIPYTGSGVAASALAMDKVLSKRLFDAAGIPTPPWRIAGKNPGSEANEIGFPLVVKPAAEGSTVGITVVREARQMEEAVALARQFHGQTLLEKFIAGRELSVGILDDEVLGTVEIRAKGGFYDYQAKYMRGDNEYLVPAPLDSAVDQAVRVAGLSAYRALGCWGQARVDIRLDEQNQPFVLEVNTLPGMTQTSLLPKIARAAGMDYGALCERILAGARCG
jgi:D-alanine-D-alanine ligase